jgi:hypothetical protein
MTFVAVTGTSGNLTCDSAFHDLDLTTVVGTDAVNAVCAIIQPFSAPTDNVFLRFPDPPPGTPSIIINATTYPPASVPCDAGVIQYATASASLILACFGYWK